MRLPASFHYFIFMGALSMISSCTEDEISSDHFLVITENQGASLTLIASPADGGSVSIQEGLYWFEAEAHAYTDHAFTGWTGDFEGAANPVRLTPVSDEIITAHFVFQDADEDGVGNSIDECSDTEKGVTVDEKGCLLPLYSDDLFLDPNGVTLKAKENAILGAYYSFNSEIYRVVDDALLRALVADDQDLSKLVTTRVTDLNNLFAATTVNFDITSWDVSNVTDMSGLFKRVSSFNQDIGLWDVSKVTNMKGLFYQASSFNQDLSAWEVGKVTAMAEMFYGSVAFNHDLSAWKVNEVTDMTRMFFLSMSFNQDLTIWEVDQVTECTDFSFNAAAWTAPQPNFTNCIK
tara:strand:- start:753 stop:1796 length:1044 start_codon:yes stop_codon:yes gene_type:complete